MKGLLPPAMFRAKLNPMAAEPLAMLPNKPEREFSNAQYQHFLFDRLQAMEPSSVASTSLLRCNCKEKCVLGDNNGRSPPPKNARRETPRQFFMTPCGASGSECTHQLACPCEGNPNDCFLMNPRFALGIWWCATGPSTASRKPLTRWISLPLCPMAVEE